MITRSKRKRNLSAEESKAPPMATVPKKTRNSIATTESAIMSKSKSSLSSIQEKKESKPSGPVSVPKKGVSGSQSQAKEYGPIKSKSQYKSYVERFEAVYGEYKELANILFKKPGCI